MEKYISITYSISKDQFLKVAQLAKEADVSASKLIRKAIDKMPLPKKKIKI